MRNRAAVAPPESGHDPDLAVGDALAALGPVLTPPAFDRGEFLREQLAADVEQFNAERDPAARVEIFTRIQSLRRQLGMEG